MDWPVIAAELLMLPAAVTAAVIGTALHRRGVRRGTITEED